MIVTNNPFLMLHKAMKGNSEFNKGKLKGQDYHTLLDALILDARECKFSKIAAILEVQRIQLINYGLKQVQRILYK